MNNNEQQLKTLTTTVSRLEKQISLLDKKVRLLEQQNTKLRSSLIAAQTRIQHLMSSTDALKSRINNNN